MDVRRINRVVCGGAAHLLLTSEKHQKLFWSMWEGHREERLLTIRVKFEAILQGELEMGTAAHKLGGEVRRSSSERSL